MNASPNIAPRACRGKAWRDGRMDNAQKGRGASIAYDDRAPERTAMKIDPISIIERALIIRQLGNSGKWEGTRRNAHVRIFRFTAAAGDHIEYMVGQGAKNTAGQAKTIADAVRDINDLITGRAERPKAPEPVTFTPARRGTAAWRLPYKDAEI